MQRRGRRERGIVPEALQPMLGEYGFLTPILAAAMALSPATILSNALRLWRVEVSQCRKVWVKYLETESLRVLPSEEVEKSWRNPWRPGSGTAT